MSPRIPFLDDARGIGTALRSCGAVVLRDALPSEGYSSAVAASKLLFGLDEAERMSWRAADPFGPGYLEYGRSRAGDTGIPNLLEAWTVNLDDFEGFPAAALSEAWGALSAAGRLLREHCRDVVSQLDLELGARNSLVELLSPALRTMLLLHYPYVDNPPEASRRQSVHVDASIVTLLSKATAPGLTVFLDGEPVDVDIADEDLLVMSGLALEKATSKRIPACLHTVEHDTGGWDRYSMVFFGQPDSQRTIAPLLPVESPDAQAVSEHNREYFSRIFPELPDTAGK